MYPYITDNNLELPQSYNYTAFNGVAFFRAYLASRKAICKALYETLCKTSPEFLCESWRENAKDSPSNTIGQRELESANAYVIEACKNEEILKLVLKTFEVNKRLYMSYDKGISRFSNEEILKPIKTSSYTHIDNYLCFAKALCAFFSKTGNILYLNALLKLNDTLLSLVCNPATDLAVIDSSGGGGGIMPYVAESVKCEIKGVMMNAKKAGLQNIAFVDSYLASTNPSAKVFGFLSQGDLYIELQTALQQLEAFVDSLKDYESKDTPLTFTPADSIELESSLAMIYALSPRSHIYLQAMLQCGIAPSHIVILGNTLEAQNLAPQIQSLGISTHCIDTQDINEELVFSYVKSLPQKYVIYSGYGGGILESKYFHISKYFIHIHAGEVPKYKGSTTCYYSLLEKGEIGSSAMFLNEGLDCGDVLGYFSLSSSDLCKFANTDIDTTLEPYIRSQALVKVLLEYKQKGAFTLKPQNHKDGETYYRIHPTLKHLALFSCFGDREISANGDTQ